MALASLPADRNVAVDSCWTQRARTKFRPRHPLLSFFLSFFLSFLLSYFLSFLAGPVSFLVILSLYLFLLIQRCLLLIRRVWLLLIFFLNLLFGLLFFLLSFFLLRLSFFPLLSELHFSSWPSPILHPLFVFFLLVSFFLFPKMNRFFISLWFIFFFGVCSSLCPAPTPFPSCRRKRYRSRWILINSTTSSIFFVCRSEFHP